MKIITWNCNGALRKKLKPLKAYDADIIVIQECEDPERTKDLNYKEWAKNYLWLGDNKNKGVGIFAKDNVKLEKLDWSDFFKEHKIKYFLPCRVNDKFNLVNVWTHQNKSPTFGYIGQLWKYLQINRENFNEIILLGDFNSNVIWDKWDRWWNHSDVVKELKELKIESLYHLIFKEEQGKESVYTYYQYRKISKPYHIDYIFCSSKFIKNVTKFECGDRDSWLKESDHIPLFCEFKF